MNELLRWILLTLGWTAILTLLALWRIPRFITRRVVRRVGVTIGGEPWNKLNYSGLADASKNPIVATSPDMLLLFGAYDVSSGPVAVQCKVPSSDNYWSISLYAWNTDNFFVLNDMSAKSREFDLIIHAPNQTPQGTNDAGEVVVSPTSRGVIIVRAVIKDRENREEITQLERVLKQIAVVPIPGK